MRSKEEANQSLDSQTYPTAFLLLGNLLQAAAKPEVHNKREVPPVIERPQQSSEPTIQASDLYLPTDGQWHLRASTGYDINVSGAWQNYAGRGVTVGIVDSGIQYTHPELSGNYNTRIDHDFLLNTADGSNKLASDGHGTAVAGNIAAANNGTGTTGVAYEADITSFRLISDSPISASMVASALTQNVDISNNSWGWTMPLVDGIFGSAIEEALQDAVTHNRNGLGTIFVFSAGNSGHLGDNTNYSEMTNSRFTIDVGAVNQDGTLAYFSTPGASLLLVAPGTSIYTTDVIGNGGFSSSNYATLQGTSFSAPITSGTIALMLEANPNLGYRDVQEILAYSSRRTDASNSSWQINGATNWNGGGLHTSDHFGFGFLDATSAVRLAETWNLVDSTAGVYSNEASVSQQSSFLGQSLNGNTRTSTLHFSSAMTIQYAELQLDLSHNRVSDLTFTLTSPDGTQSILFNQPDDPYTDLYDSNWSFSSTQFWGEMASGDWTLTVSDAAGGGTGSLSNWSLRFYGDYLNQDNTYIYTNEYSQFTGGGNAARRLLSDAAGNDTINAAAAIGNSVINLNTGSTSTIAGNSLNLDTGTVIENAFSGDGDDTLAGNGENNYLYGGRGNDTLDGGNGNDTMAGGRGNDTYYVDSLSDVIIEKAGEGNDIVYSSLANYVSSANIELLQVTGTGDFNVTGSVSNDTISGNTGNNILRGLAGNDVLNGIDGNDSLDGGVGNDTLDGGIGNDTLNGGTGNDSLIGGDGNDVYYVDSISDTITESASAGSDSVTASVTYTLSSGVENLTFSGSSTLKGTGNASNNTIIGNSGANVLSGLDGNDSLNGMSGNDSILGGNGNDTLVGLSGKDTMRGGNGDDIYYVGTGNVLAENASEGTDTVISSSISWTLGVNFENLTFLNTANTKGVGNVLNNVITGNSGNNTLDGGAGTDTLIGGLGNDAYVVDNVGDIITENAGEGTDSITTLVSYTISGEVENMTLGGTAAINGTGNVANNIIIGNIASNVLSGDDGNDSLNGSSGNDTLDAGNGNDTLDGGLGNDRLIGGDGNEVYVVNAVGDIVVENANEGNDLVISAVTYTLANDIENLTLNGSSAIKGTGNASNNILIGNAANNTLNGGDGNDSLNGRAGNDSILGGNGNDTLVGLSGKDTLRGGLGDDIYYVGTGNLLIENAGEGDDTAMSTISWTLAANIENLTLNGTGAISGIGNSSNNILTGNNSNNTLDGKTGDDTLIGGLGNDTYIVDSVGDIITENASGGTDSITALVSYTITNEVENLMLGGTTAINGTGNTANNIMIGNAANNTLDGDDGNDSLNGMNGNDSLIGGNGNDTLVGLAGNDTLQGGDGNDTYYAIASSTLIENPSEGIDTIIASINWTLATDFENLTLGGSSAIKGTGNTANNIIIGNSANNTLSGLDGNDSLNGMAGNDSILGGTGDDTLVGLSGKDTLRGGLGDDIYYTGTGNFLTENAGEGTDTIIASLSWTLGANFENLTLTGTAAINGMGNIDNNILIGNSGINALDGKAGNDTLNGGLGNDRLYGGDGDDTYIFSQTNFGKDTILDVSGTDQIDLTQFDLADVTGWSAVDGSDADHNADSLLVSVGTYSLLIQNYFSNTSADDDMSTQGAGYIETIHFDNAQTVTLAQVQGFIA